MKQPQEGKRKHTAEQTQTDGQTDGGGGGMEVWGGRLRTACVHLCARLTCDLPCRRQEEQPAAPRKRGEKRQRSLVKMPFWQQRGLKARHARFPSVSVFTCTQHSS